jgi:hypothetical protein
VNALRKTLKTFARPIDISFARQRRSSEKLKTVIKGVKKMTSNPNDQKVTCDVCHQSFSSERELQEHKQNAHSQRKQNENQPGSERNSKDYPGKPYPGQDEPKRDKIA